MTFTPPILLVLVPSLLCAAEPWTVRLGHLTLQPSGFAEEISELRSATTHDSISTRFGNFPLTPAGSEFATSASHSRVFLKGALPIAGAQLTGYIESDFLNSTPGETPYRWRQYWGQLKLGDWEILGGKAWSLLRPNRSGIESDRDLMNTDVIEPAYHVGLAGARRRQVRIARSLGQYKTAIAWESEGNALAKIVRDSTRVHLELGGTRGRFGRSGVMAAGQWNVTSRVRAVAQQYWSRRAAFEALGVVPVGASGFSTLAGIEARITRSLEVYSYSGVVRAGRSDGNRWVSEWTAGATHRTPMPTMFGSLMLSLEYSHLARSIWGGPSGAMNAALARARYSFN